MVYCWLPRGGANSSVHHPLFLQLAACSATSITQTAIDSLNSTAASANAPSDGMSGIDDLRPVIDSALEDACVFGEGCPDSLAEAIRYALLAPGKRLRPALVLMAAEAVHGSIADALPGAVAVEMVHAYSLIHDDLPAMDDDDLRRGRPTVHIQFGEATAILAGDALLAEAFSHLAHQVTDPRLSCEAIRSLGRAAGPTRLVGGQADDLAAEAEAIQENTDQLEYLESIHRRKTGALFAASIDLGAILAGGSAEQRKTLASYAGNLGLAFQVVDDLLDFTADADSLGKRAGKDASRGKLTYPGLLGVDGAREKANQLIESAKSEISVFGQAAWRLTWLATYVLERTH
jgi:geranylgeranyl diphosphate synthase type II